MVLRPWRGSVATCAPLLRLASTLQTALILVVGLASDCGITTVPFRVPNPNVNY